MRRIRNIKREDFPNIIQLIDGSLGEGYFNQEQLTKYLDGDNFGFVMTKDDKIVGVILNDIKSVNELCEELGIDPSIITSHSNESCFGLLNVVVVNPHCRKMGIAHSLVERTVHEFERKEIKGIVVEAWKKPNGIVNIGRLLYEFGFSEILEIDEYWKEDSLKEGFDCVSCGFPCTCSAIIYLTK
ncbi:MULTISPECIES: GNAT family N-acetyltransferase [unclassified Bacillus (in: firmicutes)]|uniref:GNAT family N-acetyltransferase n=1 Tax=unclassified Bacillus (in: firmicutes) TaxID=185979 RepID=UPI0008F08CDB|nr:MULTISPECIES: GNAT family N-acetyltransferase [unclassified Bacillus (in: firmicutes)]SFA86229.1 Ribosomal protein S18 acetylase RimI [Bacillus sp. UNCCL13]SFQ83623.1 Ribosomal protein S18 acetylase RimI [Bacillus sp. cl95]